MVSVDTFALVVAGRLIESAVMQSNDVLPNLQRSPNTKVSIDTMVLWTLPPFLQLN